MTTETKAMRKIIAGSMCRAPSCFIYVVKIKPILSPSLRCLLQSHHRHLHRAYFPLHPPANPDITRQSHHPHIAGSNTSICDRSVFFYPHLPLPTSANIPVSPAHRTHTHKNNMSRSRGIQSMTYSFIFQGDYLYISHEKMVGPS